MLIPWTISESMANQDPRNQKKKLNQKTAKKAGREAPVQNAMKRNLLTTYIQIRRKVKIGCRCLIKYKQTLSHQDKYTIVTTNRTSFILIPHPKIRIQLKLRAESTISFRLLKKSNQTQPHFQQALKQKTKNHNR